MLSSVMLVSVVLVVMVFIVALVLWVSPAIFWSECRRKNGRDSYWSFVVTRTSRFHFFRVLLFQIRCVFLLSIHLRCCFWIYQGAVFVVFVSDTRMHPFLGHPWMLQHFLLTGTMTTERKFNAASNIFLFSQMKGELRWSRCIVVSVSQ